jgi:hypothetical protein
VRLLLCLVVAGSPRRHRCPVQEKMLSVVGDPKRKGRVGGSGRLERLESTVESGSGLGFGLHSEAGVQTKTGSSSYTSFLCEYGTS